MERDDRDENCSSFAGRGAKSGQDRRGNHGSAERRPPRTNGRVGPQVLKPWPVPPLFQRDHSPMHRIGDIVDDRYQLTRPFGVRSGGRDVGRQASNRGAPASRSRSSPVRSGPTQPCAERLVAEARAAAEIAHPSVVEIYDLRVLPNGLSYLVTEPIRGETLADVIGAARGDAARRRVPSDAAGARWAGSGSRSEHRPRRFAR